MAETALVLFLIAGAASGFVAAKGGPNLRVGDRLFFAFFGGMIFGMAWVAMGRLS